MFEDALHAMESAKAAGMRVCAIADYTSEPQREAILAIADAWIATTARRRVSCAPRRPFGKMPVQGRYMRQNVRITNTTVRYMRILSYVFPKNACVVREMPV